MNLNDLQLPPSLVTRLYRDVLVGSATAQTSPKQSDSPVKKELAAFLGENKKNILIVVHYADVMHLPDDSLQFLLNMLTACKLGMADVIVVNTKNYPDHTYKEFLEKFKSRVALLFDIEPASIGLPLNFPHYQIQPFANCSFLYAPSLSKVETDKIQKSKLWVALRRLFNI